jgi:FlgN protein
MSTLALSPLGLGLGSPVLTHLDQQLASARRLLGAILAQGQAIRKRDVETVLARLADMRTEMALRGRLEQERAEILIRAGTQLGVPAPAVTLEALITLMTPEEADMARTRSAELRGLLSEIAREHGINRALMRQELAFLDHLVRLIGQEPEAGYSPQAAAGGEPRTVRRFLDLQA